MRGEIGVFGRNLDDRDPRRHRHQRQTRGGEHHAGRAHHDHQVAVSRVRLGVRPFRYRQRLAEPHDAGAHEPELAGVAKGRHEVFDGLVGKLRLARRRAAMVAAEREQAAVQVGDRPLGRAAAFVQVVDVLGGHVPPPGAAVELRAPRGDRPMSGIGRRRARQVHAPQVPGPDLAGVVAPGVEVGHRLRVDLGPQAGLRVAERGQPGFGAHSGAGEELDAAGVPGELGDRLGNLDARIRGAGVVVIVVVMAAHGPRVCGFGLLYDGSRTAHAPRRGGRRRRQAKAGEGTRRGQAVTADSRRAMPAAATTTTSPAQLSGERCWPRMATPAMAAVAGASAVSVANSPAGSTRRAAMSMP